MFIDVFMYSAYYTTRKIAIFASYATGAAHAIASAIGWPSMTPKLGCYSAGSCVVHIACQSSEVRREMRKRAAVNKERVKMRVRDAKEDKARFCGIGRGFEGK